MEKQGLLQQTLDMIDSVPSSIPGTIDEDTLMSMTDEYLQQLWEDAKLPECDTKVKAERQLKKWKDHYASIGTKTADGGGNLVKRINACRAKLELLNRAAPKVGWALTWSYTDMME